jgi:hypothetical protein
MKSAPSTEVDRVVIVHGPADAATTAALSVAGLAVAATIGDTTIWAPSRMVTPAATSSEHRSIAGPCRELIHIHPSAGLDHQAGPQVLDVADLTDALVAAAVQPTACCPIVSERPIRWAAQVDLPLIPQESS